MTFKSLVSKTYGYMVLVPILMIVLGVASNQAVLIANHGKFPVMVNERQLQNFKAAAANQDSQAYMKDIDLLMNSMQTAVETDPKVQSARLDAIPYAVSAAAANEALQVAVKSRNTATILQESAIIKQDDFTINVDFQKVVAQLVADAKMDSAKELQKQDAAAKEAEATTKTKDVKKEFTAVHARIDANASVDIQGQFLDDVHSVMGKNSHLKAQADIWNLGDAIWSVGDFGIEFGGWLLGFGLPMWLILVLRKLAIS